jgi:hypothetical protein
MWNIYVGIALVMESSCMSPSTMLRTAGSGSLSAAEIYDRLQHGPVEVEAYDPLSRDPLMVVGGCRTRAPGVRIEFADGASVELTNGHVLFVSQDGTDDLYLRAQDVRVGDVLSDKTVVSVQQLGEIDAIRLWTDRPEWLITADGVVIGSRWQEIISAWGTCGIEVEDNRGHRITRHEVGFVHARSQEIWDAERGEEDPYNVPWDHWTELGDREHRYRAWKESSFSLNTVHWTEFMSSAKGSGDGQLDTGPEVVPGSVRATGRWIRMQEVTVDRWSVTFEDDRFAAAADVHTLPREVAEQWVSEVAGMPESVWRNLVLESWEDATDIHWSIMLDEADAAQFALWLESCPPHPFQRTVAAEVADRPRWVEIAAECGVEEMQGSRAAA